MGLGELLGVLMIKRLRSAEAELASYDGHDWWQLADEEVAVFELDRLRWPALVAVWQAWDYFVGATDGWNDEEVEREFPQADEIITQARREHPEWVKHQDPRTAFMHFAAHYAEVSHREAAALFGRMHWWAVRASVITYRDEGDYPDLSEIA